MAELKVLITRAQIAQRVAEMGAEINRDYAGQSVILLGVLKGAAIFLSDLSRQLTIDATFDFIGVSSYGNRPSPAQELKSGWDSTGEVRLTKDMARQPKSLKIAALLDKPSRRKQPITADYVGFSIPDEFVVGYGLDYAEKYRNLPDICVVPREA
jgi:hypoxanthine phosphoribosyltransferase